VEVPKPLPLPGQLKPVSEKKERPKDDKQPKERVEEANARAKVDPVKDGYINAIQVYPYTKGALYQLYAAPARSPTLPSSRREAGLRLGGRHRALGRRRHHQRRGASRRRCTSW
jgi:hypothetical protein